jgi:hypothetical protein
MKTMRVAEWEEKVPNTNFAVRQVSDSLWLFLFFFFFFFNKKIMIFI